jgi:anti-sigma regulatory factor (Ser/Thr protein kinase)
MCWSLDANDVRSARAARKAATAVLRAFSTCEDTLGAAELVIGELLSNAARHADGNVCLELTLAGGFAEVSVHDTAPSFSLDINRPHDQFSESGRGLYIISELARRVEVFPITGLGKRVKVTLDLPVPERSEIEPRCARMWLRHEDGVCMRPRVARYHPELVRQPEN